MKSKSFKASFAICLILSLVILTFGQSKFKISGECGHGCDNPQTTVVHFDYGGGFQIKADFDSEFGVSITKDNFSTFSKVVLVRGMGKYFVSKAAEKRVESRVNEILLKVYRIGEYGIDRSIKGSFTEIGRFAALAELRQNRVINSTTTVKRQLYDRAKNAQIKEKDLREQMMRDGLRKELEGCEGMSTSITKTKIDLNRDGQLEIIGVASSSCWGAKGGSKIWIYQKTNEGLKALMAGETGNFKIINTVTRRFKDITLITGSYAEEYRYIFKYNGDKYQYSVGKYYQRNQSGKLIFKEVLNQ